MTRTAVRVKADLDSTTMALTQQQDKTPTPSRSAKTRARMVFGKIGGGPATTSRKERKSSFSSKDKAGSATAAVPLLEQQRPTTTAIPTAGLKNETPQDIPDMDSTMYGVNVQPVSVIPDLSRSGSSSSQKRPGNEKPLTFRPSSTPSISSSSSSVSSMSSKYSNKENGGQKDSIMSSIARSLSRGRSASPHSRMRSMSPSFRRKRNNNNEEEVKPMLVAVTSCRSDAYHHQKAPGSTSRLPRKAPSALKLFHELATGVKDAYDAVGAMPSVPQLDAEGNVIVGEGQVEKQAQGNWIIWEFMGNLDFLLSLVDEVAVDNVTRGALKDDTTFKCLRDVIKKCNKVLEYMLVRRERKYTLFFELIDYTRTKELGKMKSWNGKLEKALVSLTELKRQESGSDVSGSGVTYIDGANFSGDMESDAEESVASSMSSHSGKRKMKSASSKKGSVASILQSRTVSLPTAGKVRGRRATPTPSLRQRNALQPVSSNGNDKATNDDANSAHSITLSAADDGFAAASAPGVGALSLQNPASASSPTPASTSSFSSDFSSAFSNAVRAPTDSSPRMQIKAPVRPKDELVDVIRGLRVERQLNRTKEISSRACPSDLKPDWRPKARVPDNVPELPTEYIHRHRLMKQVVNSLLDRSGAGPRDTDLETLEETFITSITSRHADKAGNGKTTLACAAIETVEVRERFCDSIVWIKLGRQPLSETNVRNFYEEIYQQLTFYHYPLQDEDGGIGDSNLNPPTNGQGTDTDVAGESSTHDKQSHTNNVINKTSQNCIQTHRRFQGGELEGMKEDLAKIICNRKVLLCLDDVWSAEDARWFLFQDKSKLSKRNSNDIDSPDDEEKFWDRNAVTPFRVLITTRQPNLLSSRAQEVYVRIFSEHEAVKLLLASAGRRPHAMKKSPVFQDARVIVKGCGNSPLAIRLAGGMLRRERFFWTLSSPTWKALVEQCRKSLEEATRLRSFSKAVGQIMDLSFTTIVGNDQLRNALRRCFVTFAIVFHDNEWLVNGKGIPKDVILALFRVVCCAPGSNMDGGYTAGDGASKPEGLLEMMLNMHLLERARPPPVDCPQTDLKDDDNVDGKTLPQLDTHHRHASYLMHDSIKALAEEMSTRTSSSFAPPEEHSTPGDTKEQTQNGLFMGSLKYLMTLSFSADQKDSKTEEYQLHEILVASLTGVWVPTERSKISSIISAQKETLGVGVEEYILHFLPGHLIRAKANSLASELVVARSFISRRVNVMGAIKATKRQVLDLVELRKVLSRSERSNTSHNNDSSLSPMKHATTVSTSSSNGIDTAATTPTKHKDINLGNVLRDGSRRIVDEVYRLDAKPSKLSNPSISPSPAALSLNMAICLSSVGEGLLWCRQPRDAMLRLEEAVGIFRTLLGPVNTDVARALSCVAKTYVKIGESRVALLKFNEAQKIYEACGCARHYDCLANMQSMAALLVDLGDLDKAEDRYRDLVQTRRSIHGTNSYHVAKTLNDYAGVLAKHGKIDLAISQYELARLSFQGAASPVAADLVSVDDRMDTVLIDLNIASIKAKKGDFEGAISSYEDVVLALKRLEAENATLGFTNSKESNSLSKHLVVAMGRIGSLKLKQSDNDGALAAFEEVLKQLNDESPTFVKVEASRAHIKCATIYRQNPDASRKAIMHLRVGFEMYMQLYGAGHRDTRALEASLHQWELEEKESYNFE